MVNKLFVWEGVYCDWTCGIAFALAETVEEARKVIAGDDKYDYNEITGEPDHIHEITETIGYNVYGGG